MVASVGNADFINIQDDKPTKRKTALHIAVEKHHAEAARLLVSSGASADIADAAHITRQLIAESTHETFADFELPLVASEVEVVAAAALPRARAT